MIKVVRGNILESQSKVIVHQVNCQGVMGAGLAMQFRSKYTNVYPEYAAFCDQYFDKSQLLGHVLFTKLNERQLLANVFGQLNYGTKSRQTDYEALQQGLTYIANHTKPEDPISLPYGIGCGLAGGDWGVVSNIIRSSFKDNTVFIHKL